MSNEPSAMPDLPPAFVERMAQLLGDEFDAFLAAYAEPPRAGLRLNTLRVPLAFSHQRSAVSSQLSAFPPVPWCPAGRLIPVSYTHLTLPTIYSV